MNAPAAAGLPMIGAATCVVVDVTLVSIHGDAYYDTLVKVAPPAAPLGTPHAGVLQKVRVPMHACAELPAAKPEAGQRVVLQMLMGQVMSVSLAR
jgi:hypothetical protein